MKGGLGRIVRISLTGAFAAALVCQVAGNAGAVEGQEVTVHSGKVDITHGVGAEPIDQVDIIMTFTNTETGRWPPCVRRPLTIPSFMGWWWRCRKATAEPARPPRT